MYTNDIVVRIILVSILVLFFIFRKKYKHHLESKDSKLSTRVTLILIFLMLISPNVYLRMSDIGIDSKYGNIVIINPYAFFRLITLITGVQALGIVLIDLLSEKTGLLFMSIFGGLASSTTMTQVFGLQSRKVAGTLDDITYAAISVIANGSSLILKVFIVGAINIKFLPYVFPFLIVHAVIGLAVGAMQIEDAFRKGDGKHVNVNYFSLTPVILFLILYFVISIANQFIGVLFMEKGDLIATGVSYLGGLNIALIEISKRAMGSMDIIEAINLIMIAFVLNIGSKIISCYTLGTKKYAKNVTIGLTITLILSLIVEYVWYYIFWR